MRLKIVGIVACQILLIASSYLIMVIFENQSAFLGNTINISGKNRFLGEMLYQQTVTYILTSGQNPPSNLVTNVDSNIKALYQGGPVPVNVSGAQQSQVMVMAVPSEFLGDLGRLSSDWGLYRADILSELGPKPDRNILANQDLENHRTAYLASAEKVTGDLSDYSKELVSDMTVLQITLLAVNVAAHLLLLRIILRLIREEQAGKALLEQVSDKNKKLEFESKFALIQKDISQSFIVDMEDKLYELNEQINQIRSKEDYEKNSRIIQELFQSLFAKIQQLARSTMEFENKVADYEQLITKLRSSTSALSENGGKLPEIKKSEDLVTIILSYLDVVNLMVSDQMIPVKLGRNLTDALHDIVDHLTLSTTKS